MVTISREKAKRLGIPEAARFNLTKEELTALEISSGLYFVINGKTFLKSTYTSSMSKPVETEKAEDKIIEDKIERFVYAGPSQEKLEEYARYIREEFATSDLESKGWLNVWTEEKQNFLDAFKEELKQEKGLPGLVEYYLKKGFTDKTEKAYDEEWIKIKAKISAEISRQKKAGVPAKTEEVQAEKETISDINIFWEKIKSFYVGRMYLSKKEIVQLEQSYNFEGAEIQKLWDEMMTYYVGRMYLSKKELIVLGNKYGLDVSGLA